MNAALCCHWLQEGCYLCPCVLRRVKVELKQMRPALFYTLLLSVLLKKILKSICVVGFLTCTHFFCTYTRKSHIPRCPAQGTRLQLLAISSGWLLGTGTWFGILQFGWAQFRQHTLQCRLNQCVLHRLVKLHGLRENPAHPESPQLGVGS